MLSTSHKALVALFVALACAATLINAFPVAGSGSAIMSRHAALARRAAAAASSGNCKPKPSTAPPPEDDDEDDEDDDDEDDDEDYPEDKPATTPATTAKAPSSTKKPSNETSNDTTDQSGSAPANIGGSRALFPAGLPNKALSWTTSTKVSGSVPLSDATFKLFSNIGDLKHPYVKAPDGVQSMQITYPRGTAALSGKDTPRGGVSFYGRGPVDLTRAKEATFSFSVLFEKGFQFKHGGKLPGLYGGDSDSGSVSCSGGRQDTTCFSTRFMWRDGGAFEGYFYLPPVSANKNGFCKQQGVDCNDQYGASVSRGVFKFTPGVRTTISQRVRLNDAGKANGEIELYHNGVSVRKVTNVIIRNGGAGRIRGIQMQSFFGGHGDYWVSPQTQHSYLSDFSVVITQTL